MKEIVPPEDLGPLQRGLFLKHHIKDFCMEVDYSTAEMFITTHDPAPPDFKNSFSRVTLNMWKITYLVFPKQLSLFKDEETMKMPPLALSKEPGCEWLDNVNHPTHYNSGKIEVVEAIEDWKLNFHRGNAVKYTARAGRKDPTKEIEDLKKAVWYLNREIEVLESVKEERPAIKPNDMVKNGK